MMLYAVLAILIMITSLFLVLVIMAQNPKDGGLSGVFGGSVQMFGHQRTNNFLEKTTWFLSSIILVLVLFSNAILRQDRAEQTSSLDSKQVKTQNTEAKVKSNEDQKNKVEAPGLKTESKKEKTKQQE